MAYTGATSKVAVVGVEQGYTTRIHTPMPGVYPVSTMVHIWGPWGQPIPNILHLHPNPRTTYLRRWHHQRRYRTFTSETKTQSMGKFNFY